MAKRRVRTPVPAAADRRIRVEAGYRCSIPRCGATSGLEIHHIDDDPSNHSPDNLLLVCAICHARITKREIDRSACLMVKDTIRLLQPDVSKQDLEAMEARIIAQIEQLVGRQPLGRIMMSEDLGKGLRNPGLDAAAEQASVYTQANVTLPADLLRALGYSLYVAGELDQALAVVDAIVKSGCAGSVDHMNRGLVLSALGRTSEAEAAFRRQLKHMPQCSGALNQIGILLLESGHPLEAIPAFRRAVSTHPATAGFHRNLALALERSGRLPEAEDAFRAAMRLEPHSAEHVEELACFFQRTGNVNASERAYRKALELEPQSPIALNALGILRAQAGDEAEAEQLFRRVATADQRDFTAWCNLGTCLSHLGRDVEAERAYSVAVAANPDHSLSWSGLSHVLAKLGRRAEAAEACRRACAGDSSDPDWRNSNAYSLYEIGLLTEAEDEALEALRIDPDHAYANATLGLLLFEKDELAEGRQRYERAIRLSPSDLPLQQKFHYECGRALARNGRLTEARTHLEEAKGIDASYVSLDDIDAELARC